MQFAEALKREEGEVIRLAAGDDSPEYLTFLAVEKFMFSLSLSLSLPLR